MKRHGPFSSPGHVRDHEPFFYSLGSCDPPTWIPPTVTPCGYGRLWGPSSAVWQQPDTRCAPTPAWIPPTVTPCGYGRLWGPGSAVWQQPDTKCAPTPAWIPPTVTPCSYGRLWGPSSAVWQQPDTRCAPWGSGIVQRWASVVAKPRALCLAMDEQTARLGRQERDHRQLRWPARTGMPH